MPVTELNEEELPKRLDKETINELPLIRFHGAIQVAEDAKSFNRYASRLKKQRVLGFDIECKPNFKRGPNNPPAHSISYGRPGIPFSALSSNEAWPFDRYPQRPGDHQNRIGDQG